MAQVNATSLYAKLRKIIGSRNWLPSTQKKTGDIYMTKVVQLVTRQPYKKPPHVPNISDNLHITVEGNYSLSQIAIGISMAMVITKDYTVVDFLLRKFNEAVAEDEWYVYLDLDETRRYLDYLDIVNSTEYSKLNLALCMSQFD